MDAQIIDDSNRFEPSTGVIPTLSPLNIDIKDDRLLEYVCYLEDEADTHWNGDKNDPTKPGKRLKRRREQNIKYYFGKQLVGLDLKKYESEFIDNVIKESEDMLEALATSKMPDIIISPGGIGRDDLRTETAEMLSKINDKYLDEEEQRSDFGLMFKHLPNYFIAVRKYRWDDSKNDIGDIVEEVINPDHIVVDHTALSSNPDEMLYIIHYVEKTAKEWVMLFPKKEKEILEFVRSIHHFHHFHHI